MATTTQTQIKVNKPLVRIKEMDHIVLRCRDMEATIHFYADILGMPTERIEEWRAGKCMFPSVRLTDDTIIDLFAFTDQPRIGRSKEAVMNQDHFCMVIEEQDLDALKTQFEDLGIDIHSKGPRWGARGTGQSLYVYDPDDNVVELRYY